MSKWGCKCDNYVNGRCIGVGECEKQAKITRLAEWKESAMSVTPPLQEIAKALGLKWGESVHDKILPGILELKETERQFKQIYAMDTDTMTIKELHQYGFPVKLVERLAKEEKKNEMPTM